MNSKMILSTSSACCVLFHLTLGICFLFIARGVQRERGRRVEGARVPVPLISSLGEDGVFLVQTPEPDS